jgi:murein DD-endopeptidase MepM/ murein hydrolase activator NlpD
MTISNAPAADAQRRVLHYSPTVNVDGVTLGLDPTHGACLSSGFGARGSGLHKGIDYYSASGGPIEAAADGVIIERVYRDDYGNMLLIDHGHGVYTRYAHLSSFADGVVEGAHVRAGQRLGLMGNTASYQIPVHLHYELLLGDYANPKKSFGLTPHSPFEYMGR